MGKIYATKSCFKRRHYKSIDRNQKHATAHARIRILPKSLFCTTKQTKQYTHANYLIQKDLHELTWRSTNSNFRVKIGEKDLKYPHKRDIIIQSARRYVGIGRRGRLKICCWQQRMGSSPITCINRRLFVKQTWHGEHVYRMAFTAICKS